MPSSLISGLARFFKLTPRKPFFYPKAYTRFTVEINGDDSYFAIPTEDFEKLEIIACKKGVSKTTLIQEAVKKHGFSADIVNKIIEENK